MTRKRLSILVCAALTALLLTSTFAFAQSWKGPRGSGGWGSGTKYNKMYNPAAVETLSGEVSDIQTVVPYKGMNSGVQIIVKTDKETVPVHLGPSWYIERLDFKIVKGDRVEVKGSRSTFAGRPVFIAGELKKGDQTLVLRDANGVPVWSGWRR